MPDSPPDQTGNERTLRVLLRFSGVLFVLSLGLVLLDVLFNFQLPSPIRPMLPWALLASMLLGTTLLVGILGMPKRPGDDD